MNKAFLILLLISSNIPVFGISPSATGQTFTLGGRYSSYSTDFQTDLTSFETGREGGFGIAAAFRSGGLVVSGAYDRDSSGEFDVVFIPLDLAEYSRSRFEASVGYSVLPFLDLEGGVRLDDLELGGILFSSADASFEHQAVTAGVTFHTPTIRPVGWYGTARAYLGTADISAGPISQEVDTTGYRLETGLQIPLGTSNWEIIPGAEWEVIETDEDELLTPDFDFESNRLFIMFAYTFGR